MTVGLFLKHRVNFRCLCRTELAILQTLSTHTCRCFTCGKSWREQVARQTIKTDEIDAITAATSIPIEWRSGGRKSTPYD